MQKGKNMIEKNIKKYIGFNKHYTELRLQRNTSKSITFLDGVLVQNTSATKSGVCARVYIKGSYGFASAPSFEDETIQNVLHNAEENAVFLSNRQNLGKTEFPSCIPYTENLRCTTDNQALEQKQIIDFCSQVDHYINTKYYHNS